jgi:hypothetical protein
MAVLVSKGEPDTTPPSWAATPMPIKGLAQAKIPELAELKKQQM